MHITPRDKYDLSCHSWQRAGRGDKYHISVPERGQLNIFIRLTMISHVAQDKENIDSSIQ